MSLSSLRTSIKSTQNFISIVEQNHLLQLCSHSKLLNQGRQVHQQIAVSGAQENPFTLTKLIQFYADCDDFPSVQKLFDKLPQRNVFSWTAVLGFNLRHGLYHKCVQNYGSMKFGGVMPDSFVFPKVLKACAQLSWLNGGTWVHKDVIVCGCEFNLIVSNSLIDMYAKCGDVKSARWVFDGIGERDLLSWNSMISGYVCNGLLDVALELSSCLRSRGVEHDIVTWNTIMDGYCRMGLCDEAWKVLEQMEEPNIISWTTLISGYSRMGQHQMSLRIFKDMVNRGKVSPDLDALSNVLLSCRHVGALKRGKEIHGYGIKMETAFYSSAGPALLTLYAKCGRILDARTVFELMNKSDVVTWNAMILGFVEVEDGQSALECFIEMQRRGIKSDQTTLSTVLPVCVLKYGKQIHAYVMKAELRCVLPVWNALIYMYCKCGCVGSAYSVFSNMETKDLVSHNTMIAGFGMHGRGKDALQLLRELNQSGLKPDYMTFTSVLTACGHSGLVDEGVKLFHDISSEHGVTPRMEHYSCVVDMLARSGRLEEAVNFIFQMPIEPDKHIWGALLAACRAHPNPDLGELAAVKLIRLEPQHVGHYVTLSNIYARAGRWDDAAKVRKQIEGRGLVKPSGQSWIEIGS